MRQTDLDTVCSKALKGTIQCLEQTAYLTGKVFEILVLHGLPLCPCCLKGRPNGVIEQAA